MSDYGIKISKPGVDVSTADDKDLVWSSDFNTFKVFKVVVLAPNSSVAHGLDYAPAFLALMNESGTWGSASLGYQGLGYTYVSVDEELIYNSSTTNSIAVILFIDALDEWD